MVTLREITRNNFWDCVKLKVADNQTSFVASNAISIGQSKVFTSCIPKAIYSDEQIVGFIMHTIDVDDGEYWISRLMIDERYQRKGYGKQALKMVIEKIKEDKTHDKIKLGVHIESVGAVALYKSCGFEFTGELWEGEHIMKLDYS